MLGRLSKFNAEKVSRKKLDLYYNYPHVALLFCEGRGPHNSC